MSTYDPLGINSEIPFGKYKGLLVREVAEFNPGYFPWLERNLEGFALTDEAAAFVRKQCQRHEDQRIQRMEGWAWGFGRQAKAAAKNWRRHCSDLERRARKRAAESRPSEKQGYRGMAGRPE